MRDQGLGIGDESMGSGFGVSGLGFRVQTLGILLDACLSFWGCTVSSRHISVLQCCIVGPTGCIGQTFCASRPTRRYTAATRYLIAVFFLQVIHPSRVMSGGGIPHLALGVAMLAMPSRRLNACLGSSPSLAGILLLRRGLESLPKYPGEERDAGEANRESLEESLALLSRGGSARLLLDMPEGNYPSNTTPSPQACELLKTFGLAFAESNRVEQRDARPRPRAVKPEGQAR
jgi:hypothetical protein